MSRKRSLGRGLDALLGSKPVNPAPTPVATPETDGASAPTTLSLDRLHPNRMQPRTTFREEDLKELTESISAQGIVQPLVVTPDGDGYAIIAGERRWRAARRAGLNEVPVVLREVKDDRELLELALVENLQRSDLNPLEEAEAYRQLQEDFGLSQEEIGNRVGKTRPTVANALRLLRLPEAVQEQLRLGTITPGQARPLLRLDDEEEQVRLAMAAIENGWSAREMEEKAVSEPPDGEKAQTKKPKPAQEVHAAAAEERLTSHLQTRVEIRRKRKGGEVRIHFHSEEELMRLFDHFMQRRSGE